MDPSVTETYPTSLFVRLTVGRLDASVAWYRAVGFQTVSESPKMAHLRYRADADVMLVSGTTGTPRGSGVAVYLTLDGESVDDVAERVADAAVSGGEGPYETSWNTRELVLTDPDGYRLVFSEVVDADRSVDDAADSNREDRRV
ncbi:VOC family protein [Halogeometricum limi]|uniref:Glyoxalase-like domain-containing protein n=1 Tax=Halogeometricum limi TaxID=555875 RepID=A0A1I6GLK6_9EURY|nr:VOC family protein [Halogeometricum limi]SFR43036.1 Glyoxalase-like domain-containing protein [Halogeometricum limi]